MSLKRWSDKWAGWKTFVVNGVSLITMIILPFVGGAELPTGEQVTGLIDQGTAFAVALVNLINMILRAFTKTPIFTPVS